MKLTGLKEVDLRIIIDCISNEIFNLVMINNKRVKFGCLGIFEGQYFRNKQRYKVPKNSVKKKKIVLNNAEILKKISDEILAKEKVQYENRIIW